MDIRQIMMRLFGPREGGAAETSTQLRMQQQGGSGPTALDRLMATPDRLDRLAPPAMHQVQSGETLVSIAQSYGTSWQNLARINGIAAPDSIEPGTLLRLPADKADAAALANPGQAAEAPATGALPTGGVAPAAQPVLPASAQLPGQMVPAAITADPDASRSEDFSLWCKVAMCPNLHLDERRHRWPCTACGRSAKGASLPAPAPSASPPTRPH